MTSGIDLMLFQAIHSQCSGNWLDRGAAFITDNTHHLWFVFLIVLGLISRGKGWYSALLCLAGFMLAWNLSDEYLKPLFSRPRPFVEFANICTVGYQPHSASFPSGHTLTSFAIATLIALHFRSWWVVSLSFGFALLVGYSRVYEGVHFPSDVLGGMIFGSAIGVIWFYLIRFSEPLARADSHPKDQLSVLG